MRILVVHNRYRLPGGEDALVSAEISLLRENGFEVREHFATNDSTAGLRGAVDLVASSGWSPRAYADMRQVCARFRPDIAHVHNFWMKLSPSVHEALSDGGVAIVQTLHNFRLICPNSLLLRNGAVCEDCVGKTPWRGVARRCYRDSLLASAAVARMAIGSGRRGIWQEKVDAYIALSESSRARFVAGGIPADRIFVKPNFIRPPAAKPSPPQASRRLVYAGRLSEEKGLRVLLEAWAMADRGTATLVIAGAGPLMEELRDFASARDLAGSVEFAGHVAPERVRQLISECRAVILPSICVENFPRTLVEAFACGRAVIASDLGALGDLVKHRRTGLSFRTGDPASLALAMEEFLGNDGLARLFGEAALDEYEAKYTPAKNLQALLEIYQFAGDRRRGLAQNPAALETAGATRVTTKMENQKMENRRMENQMSELAQDGDKGTPTRKVVVGVGISTTSYADMTEVCRHWAAEKRLAETRPAAMSCNAPPGRYVCVTSVHGVVTSVFDPKVKSDLNGADAATPDGMPVVWALRSFGARNQQRVYGPTLMMHLCRMAAGERFRIFLYGAKQATLDRLTENLRRQVPGLEIAGTFSPPFRALTAEERADVQRRIVDSGADLVFVGLSTPRQERWMAENRPHLPGIILIGVGAAFDFHAGTVRQAPDWMQRRGLEWLFRLCMEPGRLWKRYLLVTPVFIPLWALQKARVLRYSPMAQGSR